MIEMAFERYWIKELIDYKPCPDLVKEFTTPPCQVYQRLKERIREVLEPEEMGIFVNLTKLECLAWIISKDIPIKYKYEDLWMMTKELAEDLLKKMEGRR